MKPPTMKPPTMKDVAERAGVHASVVSRLVNADPRQVVAAATRQRIEQAMRELNYRPNLVARSLRTARSHTVGFLVQQLANPLYTQIVSGACRRAAARGYLLMLSELEAVREGTDFLRQAGLSGLLLAGGTLSDSELVSMHAMAALPVVLVNHRGTPTMHHAIADDDAAVEMAVEHLWGLGHRRIGYLSGPAHLDTTRRRYDAMERILRHHRQPVAAHGVADDLAPESGHRATREMLTRTPALTALVCSTVSLAIGALRGAADAERHVPASLSIATLHEIEFARYTNPPLTTVRLPMEAVGTAALDLLIDLVHGVERDSAIVTDPPVLIEGGSTARAPRR